MNAKRNSGRLRAAIHLIAGKVLPVVVGLSLLIVIIAWLSGAFEEKIAPGRLEMPSADVSKLQTERVHEVSKEHIEEALGTLKAASRTVIAARLLGVIEELNVAAGDQVDRGDVLVRLQDEELRTRVQQAEQALRAAVANREDAEKDMARNEQLFKNRAVAKSAVEEATRRLQVTQAEERRAEQSLEEARVMLSYTIITAPKSGRVIDRLAQPGDTIRPGDPILVLYDEKSLRLEAAVPERLVAQLKVGETLEVIIDAHGNEPYEGTIDEIVPQADAPSRSFVVKVALPRAEGLFEGMFGRLRIPVGVRDHLCMATDALQRMGQLEFVDVLVNGTIQRRMVQTGQLGMPGRVEVLSGLAAGDEIVIPERIVPPQDKE